VGGAKPGQDDIWRGDSIWSDIDLGIEPPQSEG
jgi:hypothetical protein